MNIEVLGPRASGKTTLSEAVAQEFGIEYVSLGRIARAEIKKRTKIGKEMEHIVDNKLAYPPGFLVDIIHDNLATSLDRGGFVLDGYPRRASEASELGTILDKLDSKLDFIIDVDSPLEVLLQRAVGRYICNSCDFQGQPERNNNCPHCKAPLQKREDDSAQDIEDAYFLYQNERSNILSILNAHAIHEAFRVDSSRPPQFVVAGALHIIRSINENNE